MVTQSHFWKACCWYKQLCTQVETRPLLSQGTQASTAWRGKLPEASQLLLSSPLGLVSRAHTVRIGALCFLCSHLLSLLLAPGGHVLQASSSFETRGLQSRASWEACQSCAQPIRIQQQHRGGYCMLHCYTGCICQGVQSLVSAVLQVNNAPPWSACCFAFSKRFQLLFQDLASA